MTSTISNIGTTPPHDDQPLCYTPDGVHTRRDWYSDVGNLTIFLGNRSESRWGLYAASTYDFSVGLFALWHSGKTPVIPPLNTPGLVKTLSSHVDGLLGEFPIAERIIRRERELHADGVHARIRPDADLVMFTSGSSGEPKAIRKNIGQLEAEVATLEMQWGSRIGQNVVLATVSHQHIYGLLFKLLWPLAANRPYYAGIVRDPQTLVALSARHRGAVWVSSPAFLKRIPPQVLDSNGDTRVMLFSSGGLLVAPIAHRIGRHMEEPPIEVYGSTETGGIAYRQQRPPNTDTPWIPLPKVDIDANADGQLLVRSPHLPDNGWHLTGDRGTLLAGGRFCLGNRIDRIVKVEEKRVSLTAMETELAAVAGVTDAACFLRSGRRDMICAVLALDSAGYLDLYANGRRSYIRRLRDILAAQFDRVTLPRKWRFVEEFPVNDQGKVATSSLMALMEPTRIQRLPRVTAIDYPTENDVTLTLFIPRNLIYFDGHFADMPVLPGIAQLFWVGHFARQLFGVDFVWRHLEAVKFNRLVLPECVVTLHLVLRDDRSRVQFSYAVDAAVCSLGRLFQRE